MSDFYYANLAFLAGYGEGTTNDEIESEVYRLAFQQKGTVHYDRNSGGSFQDLEQQSINEATNPALLLQFSSNLIESVAEVNESRNNNPYIVIGFSDVVTSKEGEELIIQIKYRLLQNLLTQGTLNLGL